jgi:hypothetical protein
MNRETHTVLQTPMVRQEVGECQEWRSDVAYMHIRLRCPDPSSCEDCRLCSHWLCGVCGGVEGTLTKGGCPGFRLSLDELDWVFEMGISAREARELWAPRDEQELVLPG